MGEQFFSVFISMCRGQDLHISRQMAIFHCLQVKKKINGGPLFSSNSKIIVKELVNVDSSSSNAMITMINGRRILHLWYNTRCVYQMIYYVDLFTMIIALHHIVIRIVDVINSTILLSGNKIKLNRIVKS